jgi:hypothetical protein
MNLASYPFAVAKSARRMYLFGMFWQNPERIVCVKFIMGSNEIYSLLNLPANPYKMTASSLYWDKSCRQGVCLKPFDKLTVPIKVEGLAGSLQVESL